MLFRSFSTVSSWLDGVHLVSTEKCEFTLLVCSWWTSVHQRVSIVSLRRLRRYRCAKVAENVLAPLRKKIPTQVALGTGRLLSFSANASSNLVPLMVTGWSTVVKATRRWLEFGYNLVFIAARPLERSVLFPNPINSSSTEFNGIKKFLEIFRNYLYKKLIMLMLTALNPKSQLNDLNYSQ